MWQLGHVTVGGRLTRFYFTSDWEEYRLGLGLGLGVSLSVQPPAIFPCKFHVYGTVISGR